MISGAFISGQRLISRKSSGLRCDERFNGGLLVGIFVTDGDAVFTIVGFSLLTHLVVARGGNDVDIVALGAFDNGDSIVFTLNAGVEITAESGVISVHLKSFFQEEQQPRWRSSRNAIWSAAPVTFSLSLAAISINHVLMRSFSRKAALLAFASLRFCLAVMTARASICPRLLSEL